MLLRLGLMSGVLVLLGAATFATAGALCGSDDCCAAPVAKAAVVADATTKPSTQPAAYVCPMHPDVTSDKPGKCPKCGMALVAPKKVEQPAQGQ